MNTEIIEKIQKLLALSESSNENEAKIAMLKAQEMLVRHKLSMKEVKEYKLYSSQIKNKISNVSFKKAKWKGRLAGVIGDNFGCYVYYCGYGTNQIVFFGREEDVTVCDIVLSYAIDTINSAVRRLRYSYYKKGCGTSGLETDYAIGFISGLREAFEAQKKKNAEWGLVLVKDKEVTDAYSNISFNGSISTKSKYSGYTGAYLQGREDGVNFSISDKITEGNADDMPGLLKDASNNI